MCLRSKVAVVTGGGSGFGRGIAMHLASAGVSVAVADINAEAAEKVSSEIKSAGGKSTFVQADVAGRTGTRKMVEAAVEAFGSLDILVNNAGMPMSPLFFADLDDEKLDQILAINYKSVYFGAAAAFPHMKEKGGVIVNTTSMSGIRPRPGTAAYAASKAAAQCLTKSLALELAPFKIRVNAVAPVTGDTPMLAQFNHGHRTKEHEDRLINTIPLGRLCTPDDVAAAVLYLVSDQASFVTGIEIQVDGGRGV